MASYKCSVVGVIHDALGAVDVYLDAYQNILILGAKSKNLSIFAISLQDFIRQHFEIEAEIYFQTDLLEGWTHAICE